MKRVLIAASKYSDGWGSVEHQFRLAVFEWRDEVENTAQRWSIHLQVPGGDLLGGFYYNHLPILRFLEKINENNEMFPKGTGNYIPGLDFINTEGIEVVYVEE